MSYVATFKKAGVVEVRRMRITLGEDERYYIEGRPADSKKEVMEFLAACDLEDEEAMKPTQHICPACGSLALFPTCGRVYNRTCSVCGCVSGLPDSIGNRRNRLESLMHSGHSFEEAINELEKLNSWYRTQLLGVRSKQ